MKINLLRQQCQKKLKFKQLEMKIYYRLLEFYKKDY